jgi:hypothetical protein
MLARDQAREVTAVQVSGTIEMQSLKNRTGGCSTRHARLEDGLWPKEAHEPVEEREIARAAADVGRSCPWQVEFNESLLSQPDDSVPHLNRFSPECGVDAAREAIEVRRMSATPGGRSATLSIPPASPPFALVLDGCS